MMKTSIMFLLSITLLTLALGRTGCTEGQLSSVDRFAQDVHEAAEVLTAEAHGPAAALLPQYITWGAELLGLGFTGLLALWKTIRASRLLEKNRDLAATLGAVVEGVEAAGDQAKKVKQSIAAVMRDREIYSLANPIVDQVKKENS